MRPSDDPREKITLYTEDGEAVVFSKVFAFDDNYVDGHGRNVLMPPTGVRLVGPTQALAEGGTE